MNVRVKTVGPKALVELEVKEVAELVRGLQPAAAHASVRDLIRALLPLAGRSEPALSPSSGNECPKCHRPMTARSGVHHCTFRDGTALPRSPVQKTKEPPKPTGMLEVGPDPED